MLEQNKLVCEKQREISDNTFSQGVPLIYTALGINIDDSNWRWEISSFAEDTKQSTDIKIIHIPTGLEIMVAYRMRTHGYIDRYPIDITFRYGNMYNVPSEFQKVMAGAADIGFYGFTDEVNNIVRWIIISFYGFRSVHHIDEKTGLYVPDEHIRQLSQQNTAKGDTSFVAYKSLDFKAHDESPITSSEDKIILAHSLGYFDDIIEVRAERKGLPRSFKMKDKIDRIDRY